MKKILFGVAALGLLGLAGAGLGLKAQDTVEAKADGTKTIYVLANWNDYSNPRIYYFGGSSSPASFGQSPSMNAYKFGTIGSTEEGVVYAYDIPADTTGVVLISESNDSKKTADFNFGGAFSDYASDTFHLVYDSADKLAAASVSYVPEGAAYLRGSWLNGWNCLGQKKMRFVCDGVYSLTTTYSFTEDSNTSIKMITVGENATVNWYHPTAVEGNADTKGYSEGENAWIGVNNAYASVTVNGGTYTINTDNSTGIIDAIDFASRFTDAMHATCPISSGNVGYDAVETQWNAFSTEYTETLSSKAKALLESSESQEIVAFRTMYSIVLGKTDVSAFSGLDISSNRSVLSMDKNTEINGTTIAIVITFGVIAVGAFMLIHRKKEN